MVSQLLASAAVLVAACQFAAAQTTSACDPTKGGSCAPNKAFGGSWGYDFSSKSKLSDIKDAFNLDGGVEYASPATVTLDGNGAAFLISKPGQAPTINTTHYLFFGRLDVVMKPAKGQGIVSSIVLESDDRDEIDWEFIGSKPNEVQVNFYHKGDFDNHQNGKTFDKLPFNPFDDFHTYTVEWTPGFIRWSIDGSELYTTTTGVPAGTWPQTPSQVQLGTWPAGDAPAKGTSDWAGGPVQWGQAPFTAVYKSVKVVDYGGGNSGASTYSYGDQTGDWKSIKVNGGSPNAMPQSPGGTPSNIPTSSSSSSSSSASSKSSSASTSSSISKSTSTLSVSTLETTPTGIVTPVDSPAGNNRTTASSTPPAPTNTKTVQPNAGSRNGASLLGLGFGLLGLLLL